MYLAGEKTPPLETVEQLLDYFITGCKPRENWLMGTEIELCGVLAADPGLGLALQYVGERGIHAIMERLSAGAWSEVIDGGELAALAHQRHQITTEPGGQFEFAAGPATSSDNYMADLTWYLEQLAEISKELGIGWLSAGCRPLQDLHDIPWMPKRRYVIMRHFLPMRGTLAMEMMRRTCTVQVNLDFSDADDAAVKFRAAMAVTSILTAMWANSPIKGGEDTGFQSWRAHIWTDVDNARCGVLPFAFEDGDIFRAYTEWALDVPMAFIYRDGYVYMEERSFRQFMTEGFQGHYATADDWGLHLSTLYPEVRIKKLMEIRGCDMGAIDMIPALGALARGFMYDADAARAAAELTEGLDFAARIALRHDVARRGLAAHVPGLRGDLGELGQELVAIAEASLRANAPDEVAYLEPLQTIVRERRTQADAMRDAWYANAGNMAGFVKAQTLDLGAACAAYRNRR